MPTHSPGARRGSTKGWTAPLWRDLFLQSSRMRRRKERRKRRGSKAAWRGWLLISQPRPLAHLHLHSSCHNFAFASALQSALPDSAPRLRRGDCAAQRRQRCNVSHWWCLSVISDRPNMLQRRTPCRALLLCPSAIRPARHPPLSPPRPSAPPSGASRPCLCLHPHLAPFFPQRLLSALAVSRAVPLVLPSPPRLFYPVHCSRRRNGRQQRRRD